MQSTPAPPPDAHQGHPGVGRPRPVRNFCISGETMQPLVITHKSTPPPDAHQGIPTCVVSPPGGVVGRAF